MKKKTIALILVMAIIITIFVFAACERSSIDYSKAFVTEDNGAKITSLTEYGKTLSKLVVPDTITSIGSEAFSDCSSLTSIEIPSSVTSIDKNAFLNCSSLEEVYYKGDLADWCGISFGSSPANPMYYASKLYINGELLSRELTISDGVTTIGAYAFAGFSSLTSIEIPSSVTSIERYAFYDCSSLTSINIPSSVTSIGSDAFNKCSSLTSIVIPSSVTIIDRWAFYGCSSLTIYCEVSKSDKPSGWASDWNYRGDGHCPVEWGYRG